MPQQPRNIHILTPEEVRVLTGVLKSLRQIGAQVRQTTLTVERQLALAEVRVEVVVDCAVPADTLASLEAIG
jgi:hypothetical protein